MSRRSGGRPWGYRSRPTDRDHRRRLVGLAEAAMDDDDEPEPCWGGIHVASGREDGRCECGAFELGPD